MMLPSETWALDSTSQLRAWASDSGLNGSTPELNSLMPRLAFTNGKPTGAPDTSTRPPFSNLITDIRPIALPAEPEWPDQLVFLDQMRGRA